MLRLRDPALRESLVQPHIDGNTGHRMRAADRICENDSQKWLTLPSAVEKFSSLSSLPGGVDGVDVDRAEEA